MKTYRDIMGDSDLDWCRCYATEDETVYYVVCEGEIVSAQMDGKDIDVKDKDQFANLARRVNPYADDYSDFRRAISDVDSVRCGCSSCPWNSVCEAMDEVIEEDEDN